MPHDPERLIFVGIKDSVVALDVDTGEPVWRTPLRTSDYVNVLWDGVALVASNRGEVWRLDPSTGFVIWRNELKGLGWGVVTLASGRLPGASAPNASAHLKRERDRQAAASGGA